MKIGRVELTDSDFIKAVLLTFISLGEDDRGDKLLGSGLREKTMPPFLSRLITSNLDSFLFFF